MIYVKGLTILKDCPSQNTVATPFQATPAPEQKQRRKFTSKKQVCFGFNDLRCFSKSVQGCMSVGVAGVTSPSYIVLNQVNVHHGIHVRRGFWKAWLPVVHDQDRASKVWSYLTEGIPTGFSGEQRSVESPNWQSALEHDIQVTEFLKNNLKLGVIAGPLQVIPEYFRISPLGAFTKKNKTRVIHDLSFPPGLSVNEGIDRDQTSVSYSSVEDIVECCRINPTPWLAKCDIKSAYMSCFVKPSDRHLLGFAWNYQGIKSYFHHNCLPFGMSSSCARFEELATSLQDIMIARGATTHTRHYLDDFVCCSGNYKDCLHSLDIILDTLRCAGFIVQDEKTVGPLRVIEYLGIMIDTVARRLAISRVRILEIKCLVQGWLSRQYATKRELLSILGKLAFCSQVVKGGKHFTRRLTDLSKIPQNLNHRVKISIQAKKDLTWWYYCLNGHNGITYFPRDWDIPTVNVIFSDASDIAAGAIFINRWVFLEFVGEYQYAASMSIAWRELLAVVLAVATFGPHLRDSQLALFVDNEVIRFSLIRGYSCDKDIMSLIRSLYFYTSIYNIEYKVFRVSSLSNVAADAISRKLWDKLFSVNPYCDILPSKSPRLILDF